MSAVGPHKPTGPTKPAVCPHCKQPYAFRCKPNDDVFRCVTGYRCRAQGYVYVHDGAEWPMGVLPR